MASKAQLHAELAEEFLSENYDFRKNILSGKVEFRTSEGSSEFKVFTKESMNSITHRSKVEGVECGKTDLEEIIFSESTPIYNPIQEYMDKLPEWDGEDRISALWKKLGNVDDEIIDFLHVWHRSCVAHWMQLDTLHGNECVPTLIGEQGCGKTTFAKRLLPAELRKYYLDHINLSNKFDKEMALTNNLLVNIDELESVRPSQQASLKQTLSKSKVNGRPIYGGSQEDRPRFASFIATTNNHHPLSDATGSRRYICVLIPDNTLIDNDDDINYEQVFAQLKHEILIEKKSYWFNNKETKRIQELNAPFMQLVDMEQMLNSCFCKPQNAEETLQLSTSEISSILNQEFSTYKPSHSSMISLGILLKTLGYESKRTHTGKVYCIAHKKSAA